MLQQGLVSLIFQIPQNVVDSLNEPLLGQITLVAVNPLVSLMMEQVNSLRSKGIYSCFFILRY